MLPAGEKYQESSWKTVDTPFIQGFAFCSCVFHGFTSLQSTTVQRHQMKISQGKRFIRFLNCKPLSSKMKHWESCSILPMTRANPLSSISTRFAFVFTPLTSPRHLHLHATCIFTLFASPRRLRPHAVCVLTPLASPRCRRSRVVPLSLSNQLGYGVDAVPGS